MGFGIARTILICIGKLTGKELSNGVWRVLSIAVLLMQIGNGLSSQVVVKNEEVCKWETFRANCSEDQVIFIISAQYGRMKMGRCAQIEPGERPCVTDALPYVDSQCGGRRTCELTLPNRDLDAMPSSCSKERISYLEVSYYCQEVYTAADQSCLSNEPIPVKSSVGYLASIITDSTHKGSLLCPWKIRLQPEQTINLTLLDFGIYARHSTLDKYESSPCLIYAVLKDKDSLSSYGNFVCGGGTREMHLLSSMTREVQIEVKQLNIRPNDHLYFLIRYEVFGCPELAVPEDASVDKISGGYRVTCKDSNVRSWDIHCVAGKWTSTQNNSCATPLQRTTSPDASSILHLHQGLMIVIVIAVAIVISTIIIVVGIFLLQKRKSYSPPESLLDSPGLDKRGNMLYYTPILGKRCLVSGGPDRPMTDLERDYATTLQMRQMVLPSAVMHPECIPSPGGDIWMCPVHGVQTAGIATGNGSLSRRNFGAYKPRMEHIYETPAICEVEVSLPQNSGEMLTSESPFYHELDPNLPQFPNVSRNVAEGLESSLPPPATSDNSGT